MTLLTSAVIAILNLATGVLTARAIGPRGRGALFSAMAIPALIAGLGTALTQQPLAKRSAQAVDAISREKDASAALSAAVVVGTFFALLAVALQWLLPEVSSRASAAPAELLYAFLWVPVNIAQINLQALDWGAASWRRFNALRAALYPLTAVGLVVLVLFGRASVATILFLYLTVDAAILLCRVWLARREFRLRWQGWNETKALLREGLRFLPSRAAGVLAANLDGFLGTVMLNPLLRGYYAVASRFGVVGSMVASGVGFVSFSDGAREGPVAGKNVLRQVAALALILYVTAIMWAYAAWHLIPVLFGRKFSDARSAAVILILGGVFLSMATVLEQRLEGAGAARTPAFARGLMIAIAIGAALGLMQFRPTVEAFSMAMVGGSVARLVYVLSVLPIAPGESRWRCLVPTKEAVSLALRGIRGALRKEGRTDDALQVQKGLS